MRIATWNVERLKHYREITSILREIETADADILVLTETDARLFPRYPCAFHTPPLNEIRQGYYRDTENRVSVFSRHPCVRRHETCDPYTTIALELDTPRGRLLVYGTIMGIFGNREASFKSDLTRQMADIRRLSEQGHRLCVAGDYNLSFGDNYYYTRHGRDLVNETFRDCGIDILTRDQPQCIDHIALTRGFADRPASIDEWNKDKRLSDHKGIEADLGPE